MGDRWEHEQEGQGVVWGKVPLYGEEMKDTCGDGDNDAIWGSGRSNDASLFQVTTMA